MDQQTLRTILELQLEDIEGLASRSKGKQKEGTSTDAHLALQIYIEELHSYDTAMTNQAAARSLVDGWKREQQVTRDQKLAERLSAPSTKDLAPSSARSPRTARLAAAAEVPPREQHNLCVACKEDKQLIVEAPCRYKHRYCRACIVQLFELAIRDDSLFPPMCDGSEIPIDSVRPFLSLGLLRRYENKLPEVKAGNRTYCHNTFCAAFIAPNSIDGGIGKCGSCGAVTCTACKNNSHPGNCPSDFESQQLKRMAKRKRWQRCYACRAYVQIDTGCNHIT